MMSSVHTYITFVQSKIVMEQLELNKPPASGPPRDPNLPLLVSLAVLGLGLCVVGLSVYDATRLSIKIKMMGAGLVGLGVFLTLLRILFSYTPSCLTCQTVSSLFHKKKRQGDVSECQISVVSKSFNKDI